jgi:hypothetical protein
MRTLNEYDVMLEGILLKPNMCLPGLVGGGGLPAPCAWRLLLLPCPQRHTYRRATRACQMQLPGPDLALTRLPGAPLLPQDAPTASPADVAKYTVRTMKRTIPARCALHLPWGEGGSILCCG